jgi:hypothetical protein
MTWEYVEEYLRRRFPDDKFVEFQVSFRNQVGVVQEPNKTKTNMSQSGDYWILNAPEPQTAKDHDEFAKLRRPTTRNEELPPESNNSRVSSESPSQAYPVIEELWGSGESR